MAKILVAEDDASVRDFVRRALEELGHMVVTAEDGAAAAAALDPVDADYDLLLADIKMPVMDGIALALKAAKDRPGMPILLMTGYADQRERAHGLDQLIDDVIAKPFTLEEIAAVVDKALSG
jgi:DNA-binding response OmpR family regulator